MIDLNHMDNGTRNKRLRETLESYGLFVHPVPDPSDPEEIHCLLVSCGKIDMSVFDKTATDDGSDAEEIVTENTERKVFKLIDGGASNA